MLHSLKAKFILAFGALIIVLFMALGLFLMNAKAQELTSDISNTSQSFAQFSVKPIMDAYYRYLEPGNFISFNREVKGILRPNKDISDFSIASYSGLILYKAGEERTSQYSGTVRTLDQATLDRVQSTKLSLLLQDGRIIYLKVDAEKNTSTVDFNEDPVTPPGALDRIIDIVNPIDNAYAVIYEVNYQSVDERLAEAKVQIAAVAGIGILLTLMISIMLSVSITRPLDALKAGALKIAGGDFNARVDVKTRDEVGVLASTFNQMAVDLAASVEAKLYKERLSRELELAAKIQGDLLPKGNLELPSLNVVGGLDPATEVGGDAFDFISMNQDCTLIYLGDGTGHGVPAGLLSSISNALLYAFREESDLKVMAKHLNLVIQKKSSSAMFITMALTIWNEKTSVLKYLNAGHLPLLYYDSANRKLTEIKLPGMAFGMVDDIVPHLKEQELVLKPNDVVVLYSDGIPDAQNERKESYGMQRLKRIVQDTANDLYTAEGIKNAILADVREFRGVREHLDDITVVVMKRK